jgi:hypothetical protein
MARPKKSDGEKRTQKIEVRVTPNEKNSIIKIAKDAGLTPSDLLRLRALVAAEVRKLPTPEREAIILVNGELGKIGSNLNQIARVINTQLKSGEYIDIPPEIIERALQEYTALSGYILRILKDGHHR